MYISLSHLRVPEQRAAELVSAFQRRVRLVEEADGFMDLQVWQSDRDPGALVMVSRWRDRRAFKAYMKSEHHRISHERIDPDLDSAIRLERLDHMHTYEVVAE